MNSGYKVSSFFSVRNLLKNSFCLLNFFWIYRKVENFFLNVPYLNSSHMKMLYFPSLLSLVEFFSLSRSRHSHAT